MKSQKCFWCLRERVWCLVCDNNIILNPNAEFSGKVDAGFHCDDAVFLKCVRAWLCVVDINAKGVPDAVDEFLAKFFLCSIAHFFKCGAGNAKAMLSSWTARMRSECFLSFAVGVPANTVQVMSEQ